jgi:hypothetical protein
LAVDIEQIQVIGRPTAHCFARFAPLLRKLLRLSPRRTAAAPGRQHRHLEKLCRHALARGPERGLLKHGCYFKPHDDGADSAVFFGDFYVARTLGRLLVPDAFGPIPAALAS